MLLYVPVKKKTNAYDCMSRFFMAYIGTVYIQELSGGVFFV